MDNKLLRSTNLRPDSCVLEDAYDDLNKIVISGFRARFWNCLGNLFSALAKSCHRRLLDSTRTSVSAKLIDKMRAQLSPMAIMGHDDEGIETDVKSEIMGDLSVVGGKSIKDVRPDQDKEDEKAREQVVLNYKRARLASLLSKDEMDEQEQNEMNLLIKEMSANGVVVIGHVSTESPVKLGSH